MMIMGSSVQFAVAHTAGNGNISAIFYQNRKHRSISSRVRKIAENDYQFRLVYPSVRLSICLFVRPHMTTWVSTGRIFMTFHISLKSVKNIQEKRVLYKETYFDVLLTVHLSIILVINQLNAQNLVL